MILTGVWKGNFQIGGDRLGITITVKDSNNQIITQALFQTPIFAYSTNWLSFTCNVIYPTAVEPYHTLIFADIGTIGQTTEGFLDDLNLTYIASTNEIVTSSLFSAGIVSNLYVNPKLIFESPVSLQVIITIYDQKGMIIGSENYKITTGRNEIPLPDRSPGFFVCSIQSDLFRKSINYFVP